MQRLGVRRLGDGWRGGFGGRKRLIAMEENFDVVNGGEDEDEDASDEADGEHGLDNINENSDRDVHSRLPEASRLPLLIGNQRS